MNIKRMTAICLISFLLVGTKEETIQAVDEIVDYSTYNQKPFLERDFSFIDKDDETDENLWQSYNANLRTCSSSFKPSTTHKRRKNITIYPSDTALGVQTVPYVAYFSNGCSSAATWQRDNKHNNFFREPYGTMVVYMPVSISYPSEGSPSLEYVYANQSVGNKYGTSFLNWGVKLNSNRCGFGATYFNGCTPSYKGGNGKRTYPSGEAGEWEDIGYSGDGYGIINSHFPTNFPKYPQNGDAKDYAYDTPFNTAKTSKTTYDTGIDATKTRIKDKALDRLISQEDLSSKGSKSTWNSRLSLKNNAATEAGVFVGTTGKGTNQQSYTVVVTHAVPEAISNIALQQMDLIYNGSTVGYFKREARSESGTQVNPSKDLYAGQKYTLRITLKNDSPRDITHKFAISYTVNNVKNTKEVSLTIAKDKTASVDIPITVPNWTAEFNITASIPLDKVNLWDMDDSATIRAKTYRDTSAPTITSAGVTTGCSASSATISVTSTDNPRDSYASGYSHTGLAQSNETIATSKDNPAKFTVYSDGTYQVYSCDNNGNCTGWRDVIVNTIDKQKPAASVSGIPNKWVNTNVTATVTGTDISHNCSGIAKAWWRINSGAWQYRDATTASVTLTETGAHKFEYAVTDRVGHHSPTLSTTVYIDKERPTINWISPVGTANSSGTLLVGGSAASVTYDLGITENYSGLSSYSYAWNNNPWGSEIRWSGNRLTVPINGAIPNQINELWFRVMDAAGNWRTTTPRLLYDTTGPTINQSQIVITPYYNNKTTANVKVTAKDNFQDAGYTYVRYIYLSNDGYSWTKYTATNNSINVNWNTRTPDGTYTLYVKAEDSLGNVGAVQTQTYITDQTKPLGTIMIGNGQNHFPNESVNLNFTYSDNLSGVSKIEFYDVTKGVMGSAAYVINNPTTQKSLNWVLKPYTASDGSIRAQVAIKITDRAGNTATFKSKEIYISRVTIQDFHLTNVVNPTVYNKNNPFRRLTHPNIPEQKLLAGGSFNFESNYIYPLGTVHNSWRVTHTATIQYHYPNGTIRNIEMTDSKVTFSGRFSKMHEIPFDIPVGTKVYIKINVKLHDSSGGVFTQDDFPKPTGSLIYLGKIQDDIRNVINFNEIK